MPTKPDILSVNTVSSSRLFHIEQVDLEFSCGVKRQYERVCPAGMPAQSVLIIPMITAREFLLISEYSVGVEDYVLGFPKGLVDAGESVHEAANRELQEEVGYKASKLTDLGVVSTSPGYFTSQVTLVVAEGLTPSRLLGDEPEPLLMTTHSLDELGALSQNPAFHDARSMAALFLLQQVMCV